MARVLKAFEKGIRVYKENSDTDFIDYLFGSGAPIGTSGETDDATVGSYYSDTANGDSYKKVTSTSSASDWVKQGTIQLDALKWRGEKVRFATDDTLTAGTFDITTLTDNDDMVIGDITVGEFAIGDCNGTPALFEITAKPAGNTITIAAASLAIGDNDTFVVQQFLPDPTTQEGQAIVHFPLAAGACVKIADTNWEFATGINISSGFTEINGTVSSSDTVESAIEKLSGNQLDLTTLTGEAQGSTDHGTFTGTCIPDNSTTHAALQALETCIDDGLPLELTGTVAQNTPTNVDTVLADDVQRITWIVTARDTANPALVKSLEVNAAHDGHGAADATQTDDNVSELLKLGNFNLQVTTGVSGAAGAQIMYLELDTTEAGGITYTVERTSALPLAG
jgi:hypothetical protein